MTCLCSRSMMQLDAGWGLPTFVCTLTTTFPIISARAHVALQEMSTLCIIYCVSVAMLTFMHYDRFSSMPYKTLCYQWKS